MGILEKTSKEVERRGEDVGPMVLPHCTWDKFGELMVSSGGRSLGLFNELLSFFSLMNMYSSNKKQSQ